jgi:hypothetical protein
MNRRDFLSGMLAAGAAPFVVTADGQLILTDDGPLVGTLYGFGAPNVAFAHDIVQLGELPDDGPTAIYASLGLGASTYAGSGGLKWVNPGGDYLDANNVPNGPTHWAMTVSPPIGPWNVTALVQKLMANLPDSNTGFMLTVAAGEAAPGFTDRTTATPPVLAVTTTTGSFSPPCLVSCAGIGASGQTQGPTNATTTRISPIGSGAAFLKFDLSAVTGTVTNAILSVTINSAPVPQSYTASVDYLNMPRLIWDPARQLGGVVQGIAATVTHSDLDLASHPSVKFYPSFASQAACEAAGWNNLNFAGGFPIAPQFITWPDTGIPAMRFSTQYPGYPSDGSTILSWYWNLAAGITEMYCRYLMKIDVDAYLGINELGVKLPGFEGGNMSYRMEHLDQSPSNQQAYGYFLHAYDAAHSYAQYGVAENRPMTPGACLVGGKI